MSQMETEINAAEEAWGKAMVAGDIDVIAAWVAEDVLIFHGSGEVEEKAAFIANLFGRIEVQSLTAPMSAFGKLPRCRSCKLCPSAAHRPRANADAHSILRMPI